MGIERPSGRRYFNIARQLVQRGHRVRILALHPDLARCPQRRFWRDGVEVWYVGQMHARKRDGVTTRFAALPLLRVVVGATCGMIAGIMRSPATVYHLGKPQPVNGMAALIGVALLRGQGFYVDCDDDERTSNQFAAAWQAQVFDVWQQVLPRLATGVTVNTGYLARRMPPAQRVVLVPNGVEPQQFAPPPPRVLAGMRRAARLAGRRVVAYCGTLALHNHPVDLLLQAFVQVYRAVPNATLLLIGGGSDSGQVRQHAEALGIADALVMTGEVPYTAVPAWLALADLSVDPVYDNAVARARSPLKIAESLLLGVPVVTGDVGDRVAMLADGAAGVLVAPGCPNALAAGIIALLHDDARRQELAAAGTVHVRQHYTWHALAAQWEGVYHEQKAHAA